MLKINWFTKILMRFTPKTFLRYAAEEQGIEPLYYDGCEMGEYEKGNVNIFDNI